MGLTKRRLEEQWEHGYSTDRDFDDVCEHCIADEALARMVSRFGKIEQCVFCLRKDVQGWQLGPLFSYMAVCIAREWDDPLNEVGREAGEWVGARVIDSDDLLSNLDEPLENDELREEFVSAFEREWCQRDPYRLEHSEMLMLSWQRFARLVRTRHRYFFLRRSNTDEYDELVAPAEMLDNVAQAIHNTPERMLRRIPVGTQLARARPHDPSERPCTAAELGSPPPEVARTNRMSPAGISMFYGAEDTEFAVAEVRPATGVAVTCARWAFARDVWCLDLTQARPIPSIFDNVQAHTRAWLRFLAQFAADLSQPVTVGSAEVDYVPTQVVTEYVRDVLTATRTGEAIDAIAYTSAVDPLKRCWVVFADPSRCTEPDADSPDALLVIDPTTIERVI